MAGFGAGAYLKLGSAPCTAEFSTHVHPRVPVFWSQVAGRARLTAGVYFLDLAGDGGAPNPRGSRRVVVVP